MKLGNEVRSKGHSAGHSAREMLACETLVEEDLRRLQQAPSGTPVAIHV